MKNSSRTTRYLMAKKIIALADNDEEFLEYTLNLCQTINKSISKNIDEESLEETEIDEETENVNHTNESAVALYFESNLNVKSYSLIASDLRLRGYKCLPSYPNLQNAMVACRPTHIKCSEVEVVVPLQDMLNKTAERLCDAVGKGWSEEELLNVELFVTTGFDSSSGHLNPHQNYTNSNNINCNAQQSLLVTSCLVQQLKTSKERSWINPAPQSTRFCRPLRISFEKEDNEAILREYNRLSQEIRLLKQHRFRNLNGKIVNVKYKVYETLYDGKCVNCILGNSSTTRCPICLASSHKFGDPTTNFEPREDSLRLGLGILHCLLKAFEYLLHLSYRTTIMEWDRRQHLIDQSNQQTEKVRKQVNAAFGVRVDQVLQGHGTTNTGNVARKCFENPIKFAEALEVDSQLVKNIALILSLIRSKQKLDCRKFERLCAETYELNYTCYPWSRMCPTLHKLLKHGADIITTFPMQIAYYSEDASESWHKFYRKNLVCHARQTSKEARIIDTFHRAVYLTDPLISLIYIQNRLKGQQKHPFAQEMKKYLMDRDQMECEESITSEDESDNSHGYDSDNS